MKRKNKILEDFHRNGVEFSVISPLVILQKIWYAENAKREEPFSHLSPKKRMRGNGIEPSKCA